MCGCALTGLGMKALKVLHEVFRFSIYVVRKKLTEIRDDFLNNWIIEKLLYIDGALIMLD